MANLLAIIDTENQPFNPKNNSQKNNQEDEDTFELEFDDIIQSDTNQNNVFDFGKPNKQTNSQNLKTITSNQISTGDFIIHKIQKNEKENDSDSDFDYDDTADPSPPKKEKDQKQQEKQQLAIITDFKKFMLPREEIRKKNYIGDAIIAERPEIDEFDEDIQNQQIGNKPQYLSKFSKITQLYDESTKEYKQQIKELGIKKQEESVIKRAKQEAKKIEEYKIKLRQSAMGGVFTNQLLTVLDKIKNNQIIVKEIVLPAKQHIQQNHIEQSKQDIDVDLDIEEPLNKGKKKKKKKKVKKLNEPIQQDLIVDVQEQRKETIKELQKIQQQEQQQKVDWDAITKKNAAQLIKVDDEEEKQDLERRKIMYNYQEIMTYFLEIASLSKEIELIQQIKENFSNQSFLQRLSSCFSIPKLATQKLQDDRDILFALSRVKLDTQVAEHEILIKTIYKKLTQETSCRLIGNHWQDIGFQGTDPKTDVRGAGILGLIHILYFIDKYPEIAIDILKYSQIQKYEFPLAVKMFEFTILCIHLMREGKLYFLCNEQNNVFEIVADVYCALFLTFIIEYIQERHDITKMNDLNVKLEKQARSNIKSTIKDYFQVPSTELKVQIRRLIDLVKKTTPKPEVKKIKEVTFMVKEQTSQLNKGRSTQQQRSKNYQSSNVDNEQSSQQQQRSQKNKKPNELQFSQL